MRRLFFAFFGIILVLAPTHSNAQVPIEHRQSDATVIKLLEQTTQESGLFNYHFVAKTEYGEEFTIDTSESYLSGIGYQLDVGDSVSLQITEGDSGAVAYLEDIHREKNLAWMVFIFAVIAIVVGRWRGVLSLLGLIVTIGVLFGYLFPTILAGNDPITSTVIASIVILAVNMHLSHGLRRQTFLAFLGTTVGLILVVFFTRVFIYFGSLSGIASEEATILFWETGSVNLPVGILAAGIILGAVGVLDDVAITQSEVVNELLLANPNTTKRELFVRAMRIGRHHIASTVNTLVLVYAGAALPVFLLFVYGDLTTKEFFNNELVAEEIIRTLAGTCALVLTVPISTWFATLAPKVVDKSHKHH